MDNPANVDNLDQFGVKMFEQFLDCVDSGMLMRNILNDRLIWLDFLANTKVRLVLTAALTHYKNSDLTPNIAKINEVISESFINETGFNPSDIMKVFTLSAISSLQLYVIDNFVHFIDTEVNKTYGDCLVFVQDLFQLDELKELGIASIEYSLDVDGETIGPVGECTSDQSASLISVWTSSQLGSTQTIQNHSDQSDYEFDGLRE